jgi:hypothetical protein
MKRIYFVLIGLFIGLVFCFGYFSFFGASSAQKITRDRWEYSAIRNVYSYNPAKDNVNKISGLTEVCYFNPNGCRSNLVSHELDFGMFLQQQGLPENFESRVQATHKAIENSFQRALTILGNDGWEMISDPELKFELINIDDFNKFEDKSLLFLRKDTKAIYFKRLKSQ